MVGREEEGGKKHVGIWISDISAKLLLFRKPILIEIKDQ